jgi:hypothetical protein
MTTYTVNEISFYVILIKLKLKMDIDSIIEKPQVFLEQLQYVNLSHL